MITRFWMWVGRICWDLWNWSGKMANASCHAPHEAREPRKPDKSGIEYWSQCDGCHYPLKRITLS